jgi:hypothetical protein
VGRTEKRALQEAPLQRERRRRRGQGEKKAPGSKGEGHPRLKKRSNCSRLYLRVVGGAEDGVADVGDDGLKGVTLVGGEFFPLGRVDERFPVGGALVDAGEANDVGEAGKLRADENVAVKNLPEAGLFENFIFARVEHFDFAAMVLIAGAFVSAKFEDAIFVLAAGGGKSELRPAFERDHERTFDAKERRLVGGGVEKGRSGFEIVGVLAEARFECGERFDSGGGEQNVKARAGRADFDSENADGADAEAIRCGNERIAEESVGEFLLAAGLREVAAEFVVLALFGVSVGDVLRAGHFCGGGESYGAGGRG